MKKTGDDHETRFAMTFKSWTSRLAAPLLALVLAIAPSGSPVYAVEGVRKVSVVSFGLFGDQGVFKREATGAAQVVAGRFGSGPRGCRKRRALTEVYVDECCATSGKLSRG